MAAGGSDGRGDRPTARERPAAAHSADTEPATPARRPAVSVGPDESSGLEDTLLRGPAPPVPKPDDGTFPLVPREHYQMGPEFARGGLGRILEGYDRRLRRTVAVKELLLRDGHAEGRFVREALITARLEHPNIVAVHEAGRWPTGERFYAMKLVKGRTLAEHLESATTDGERLALLPAVIDVCDAVAYAHSQGILHRDLKPSNVMLGPFGETVVIDWGLAKDLTDPTDLDRNEGEALVSSGSAYKTVDGIVVGTPPYMPPEQASAQPLDQRSDVYAVGAILYHVLTGYRPYQNVRPHQVLQAVVSHPPTPLEALSPDMPRDLVAIVHKAMAREPSHRYPSAKEMAEELRRFQAGQLVGAHDYSLWEIARRFVARQKAAVFTAMAFALVLLVFGAWSFENIRAQRNAATEAAEIALARLDRYRLERARATLDSDPTAALAELTRIQDLTHVSPGAASLAAEAVDLGVARHVLVGHTQPVDTVAESPDGTWVASAGRDEAVRLWNAESGAVRILSGHRDRVSTLAFSPDGALLASGSHDGTVRLWSLKGGESKVLIGHQGPVKGLAFSPDGLRIATVSEDRTVRVWTLADEEAEVLYVDAVDRAVTVAFSADGERLVSGGHGDTAIVWELAAGTHTVLGGHSAPVRYVAISPTAPVVAVADASGAVTVHDLRDGGARRYSGPTDAVTFMAFSPDGRRLACAGLDHAIWLWDLRGDRHRVLEGHSERVSMVAFTARGDGLVSAGWDRTVRVWDLATGESRALLGHRDVVSSVALSRDAARLVSGSWDQTVRVWELPAVRQQILRGHTIGVHAVDFAPKARPATEEGPDYWLASGGHDDQVRLWPRGGGAAKVLRGHTDHVYRVRFSPDGALVASSSDDQTVRLWRVSDGKSTVLRGHTADVEELAFSPDGRKLASAGEDNAVWLWDVAEGKGRALLGHTDHVTSVAFTPDGAHVISGSRDRTVRVWDTAGEGVRVVDGFPDAVWSVAVVPGGRALLAASSGGEVVQVDLTTLEITQRFEVPDANLVKISGDGRFFAVATLGPALWLCQPAFRICDRLKGPTAATHGLAFTPDGLALVSGGSDNTVRLWDVETGEHRPLIGHELPVFDVAVSPDSAWVASASADTEVRLWPMVLPPKPEALMAWIAAHTTYVAPEED